ncbi:MAG: hypothetical protein Q9196_005582, partial [Gyalolechia fulgens]
MSPTSAVFMRSNLTEKCSSVNQPYAVAAIYYEKADKTKTPQSTATVFDNSYCGNDPLTQTKPLFPFPALQNAATTQDLAITFGPNSTGTNVWYMNQVSFRANYDHPVLLLAAAGNTSYPDDPGVGTWDGKITNYPFTQRRDVQIVQGQGYLVIQYDTDNPGVWPFHCHIAWHVSGGLYVNLMEHPDQIRQKVVPQ